jgi:hypothetical protein
MTDYIVFYSLTGKSRETAERFARAIEAKLLEIVEVRPKKPGFRGFTSGVLDSLFERRPEIKSTPGLATSDRVILCGPIWAGRVAGPIRTWLNEHGKQAGQFVWVPHSGANRAWPKAIAEITDSPAIRPRESSPLRRATSPRARPRVRPPSLPHRLSN